MGRVIDSLIVDGSIFAFDAGPDEEIRYFVAEQLPVFLARHTGCIYAAPSLLAQYPDLVAGLA